MKGGLLLDVVVTQRPAILELLARKDEPLLIGRDALLVLDLLLDIVNGVGRLDVERDRLSREGLDKDWNCKQIGGGQKMRGKVRREFLGRQCLQTIASRAQSLKQTSRGGIAAK